MEHEQNILKSKTYEGQAGFEAAKNDLETLTQRAIALLTERGITTAGGDTPLDKANVLGLSDILLNLVAKDKPEDKEMTLKAARLLVEIDFTTHDILHQGHMDGMLAADDFRRINMLHRETHGFAVGWLAANKLLQHKE